MLSIERYTPEYVLRLQHRNETCECPACQQQPAQITHYWQNQIRQSAHLSCDRAAQEILCREDAFALHCEMSAPPQTAPLDPRQQALNQAAINLAVVPDVTPEVILYTLGVLISKGRQLADASAITALGDELTALLQQGAMTQAWAQLPVVETYKIAALQALGRSELDASLDPLTGMTLVLKLSEINVLTPCYLQDMLHELEQSEPLAAFMQSQRRVFIHVLLYTFYHHAFPGADETQWEQQYYQLCQQLFSLKMLSALLLQSDLLLDEETFAALCAAWQRKAESTPSDNPLLAGIALLR